MLEKVSFGRREIPVPVPVARSFFEDAFDPLEGGAEFLAQGPTPQQFAIAKLSFTVVDMSRPGHSWRDKGRPFAVVSGDESYGCYATEREALVRIIELKNPV